MGLCYAWGMNDPKPAGIPAPILKNSKAIDLYTVAVWALAAIGVLSVVGAMALAAFGRSVPGEVWTVAGLAVGALAAMLGRPNGNE